MAGRSTPFNTAPGTVANANTALDALQQRAAVAKVQPTAGEAQTEEMPTTSAQLGTDLLAVPGEHSLRHVRHGEEIRLHMESQLEAIRITQQAILAGVGGEHLEELTETSANFVDAVNVHLEARFGAMQIAENNLVAGRKSLEEERRLFEEERESNLRALEAERANLRSQVATAAAAVATGIRGVATVLEGPKPDLQILSTGVWREPENKGKFDELSKYMQDKQAGELKMLSQQEEATLEAGCVFGMLTKHYPEKVAGKSVITVGTGRGSCQWVLYEKGSKGESAKTIFSKGYARDAVDPGKAEDKAAAFNELWSSISDKSADGVVIATWGASGAFVDWPPDPNQINENIVSTFVAKGKGGLEWINSEAQGVNMLVLSSMTLPDGTKWMINWCSEDRQAYVDLGSGKAASVKGPGGEQVGKIQFDFQTESITQIGDKVISMNKDVASKNMTQAVAQDLKGSVGTCGKCGNTLDDDHGVESCRKCKWGEVGGATSGTMGGGAHVQSSMGIAASKRASYTDVFAQSESEAVFTADAVAEKAPVTELLDAISPDDSLTVAEKPVDKGLPHIILLGGCGPTGECLDTIALMPLVQGVALRSSTDFNAGVAFKERRSCKSLSRRCLHASVLLSPSRLMILGGMDSRGTLQSTEILDLHAMQFQVGPRMTMPRQGCAVVAIDQHQVLVIGGSDGSNSLNSTEIFNMASHSFAAGPKMISARWGCAAARLDHKRVIIIGGRVGNLSLKTTEILDLDTFTVTAGPKLSFGRFGPAAVMLDKESLMVIGGNDGPEHFDHTEVLYVSNLQGVRKGPTLKTKRSFCSALMLDDTRLLVAGGSDGVNSVASSELLDMQSSDRKFKPGALLDVPRARSSAVFLPSYPPPPEESVVTDVALVQVLIDSARADLIRSIFDLCTGKDKTVLLGPGLQCVGEVLGIDPADWKSDFPKMCNGGTGLDIGAFTKLLDARSGLFYCSGHQLSWVLGDLQAQAEA